MVIAVLAFSILFLVVALAFVVWRWTESRTAFAKADAEVRHLQLRLTELAEREERMKEATRAELENHANRIFDALLQKESRHLQESSEQGLEKLLNPLKERLKDFEKKIEDAYRSEGQERFALKSEVARLIEMNEKMIGEANSLTRALTGDNKFQGDWGELVLETILESSGLREGIEYLIQKSLESEEGGRQRPDVIVQLPDGKQIIVDAKVSLTSYEAYARHEGQTELGERERHLKAHVESLNRHIDQLAEKHYPKLKGLRTPEFVFLFTPIEPAYLLAMREDPDLATRAWKKGVAVVTATTLFTSLKTVASIWRLENQNRNAQEIADEAAKLYDKFVGFHEDFEKVGRSLEASVAQYEDARRKLRDGPGNVFRKIELLRELGATPAKRLKPELLE